jgi:hypothetical protein
MLELKKDSEIFSYGIPSERAVEALFHGLVLTGDD